VTVDFTHRETTEDLDTGRPTTVTVPIPGRARRIRGDAKRYEALQLRQTEAPMLLWRPEVYGQEPDPSPGDTCSFGGQQWTAKDVDPWAPDGQLVHARIIVVGA
jgi:hypothetical protein